MIFLSKSVKSVIRNRWGDESVSIETQVLLEGNWMLKRISLKYFIFINENFNNNIFENKFIFK